MLVLEKKCSACRLVQKDKRLLERLYNSSYFLPHSKDSVLQIAKERNLNYKSLRHHLNRHQFIDSQDYTEKMLQKVDKDAEKNAVHRAVKAVDAVQTIIDKGFERLDNGDITVDTNQLIRASQIKMTQEAKAKDQELATIEMVAHFLSGENAGDRVYVEPAQ